MADHAPRASRAALALGALGVVFGDIGTSPPYAVQTVFSRDAARPVGVDTDAVLGVISLVFWAVVIVVTVKSLRFRAYGERQYLTLGTDRTGWSRQRAEQERDAPRRGRQGAPRIPRKRR